jgi:hypothetical protein
MAATTLDRVPTLTGLRAALRERRDRRAEQRRLLAELATYTTPAERVELLEMVARAEAEGTDPARTRHMLDAVGVVGR